jgi:stringent starvation protein B
LRALHDWIVDGGLTPYLLVGVDSEQVQVPSDYVSDGKIVLNIAAEAVRDLQFENDSVSFSGRFGGRPFPIFVPMASVLAIYAKESGEGMMFEPEYEKGGDEPNPPDPPTPEKPAAGHLKVVK